MLYAITINPKHSLFTLDLKEVEKELLKAGCIFIELVNHGNDHLHGLVYIKKDAKELWANGSLHFEKVRNTKAYQKYMHNHDKVDSLVSGELPYIEQDMDIVESIINIGAVETVRKYGWQALKYYRQMKEFEIDFSIYGKEQRK